MAQRCTSENKVVLSAILPYISNSNASSSSAQVPDQTPGEDALPYVSSSNASSSSAQFVQQTLATERGGVPISVAALNVSNAQNNLM